ncbi:uncharacterized protein LOC134772693 [Penaeus indicus]|uniref:uncharacterized protein LOC134772693 n=1 Tax=Penaeus indicus TaxID=29960 RepID=UPI00300C3D40
MLYGMQTVPVTKFQEAKMEVAEMRILRFALRLARKNRIRNEIVRYMLATRRLGEKLREWRLRWFGEKYIGQKMMQMTMPGKRRKGRPKRRFMDNIGEDMRQVGAVEEDTQDRKRWRKLTRCGDPCCKEKPKGK